MENLILTNKAKLYSFTSGHKFWTSLYNDNIIHADANLFNTVALLEYVGDWSKIKFGKAVYFLLDNDHRLKLTDKYTNIGIAGIVVDASPVDNLLLVKFSGVGFVKYSQQPNIGDLLGVDDNGAAIPITNPPANYLLGVCLAVDTNHKLATVLLKTGGEDVYNRVQQASAIVMQGDVIPNSPIWAKTNRYMKSYAVATVSDSSCFVRTDLNMPFNGSCNFSRNGDNLVVLNSNYDSVTLKLDRGYSSINQAIAYSLTHGRYVDASYNSSNNSVTVKVRYSDNEVSINGVSFIVIVEGVLN